MTSTAVVTTKRNAALIAARLLAGVLGGMQLAGAVYFLLIAPDESVWHGPWVDVPVVVVLLTGVFLKLVVALAPGLDVARRIGLGLLAVGIGIGITLVKIPVYDEPESVVIIAVDAVLAGLLLLARRASR